MSPSNHNAILPMFSPIAQEPERVWKSTKQRDAAERFWEKVEFTDECWNWLGARTSSGYGHFTARHDHKCVAHRISYQYLVGEIPEGLDLDHLCRNRRCVRPEHLEPVTRQVNLLRGEGTTAIYARRNHCSAGHEYTAANTRRWKNKRVCRECERNRARARYQRRNFGTTMPASAFVPNEHDEAAKIASGHYHDGKWDA